MIHVHTKCILFVVVVSIFQPVAVVSKTFHQTEYGNDYYKYGCKPTENISCSVTSEGLNALLKSTDDCPLPGEVLKYVGNEVEACIFLSFILFSPH